MPPSATHSSLSRASVRAVPTRSSRRTAAAVRVVAGAAQDAAAAAAAPPASTTRRAVLAAGGLALAAGLAPRPAGAFIEAPPGARVCEGLCACPVLAQFSPIGSQPSHDAPLSPSLTIPTSTTGFRLHEDRLDGYYFFYPDTWLPVTV